MTPTNGCVVSLRDQSGAGQLYVWTWTNATAFPAGGLTAWRGVNSTNPFDGDAIVAFAPTTPDATAVAPLHHYGHFVLELSSGFIVS